MIHPTAIVETDKIGSDTLIFAYTHVLNGAEIGSNVKLADHVFVEGGAKIGNNVTVKNNVSIWDGVRIEDDCFIGPNACFTNDRFPRSPRMESVKARYSDPQNWLQGTQVCEGSTIGANATITPGITLHPYSFVAAGAVVTRDVPAFTLVAGNPAKPLGSVCSCGQLLNGSYEESTCLKCGETPEARFSMINKS